MEPKRNTIQRSLVLNAVRELQCHATAEEIYQVVIRSHPNISRTTVYRNLNQLAECGEIRKMEVVGGADRFDHICSEHYHVHCTVCGKVFDADMEYIPDLEGRINDTHGFRISGHDILFYGVCPSCALSDSSKNP